MRKYLAIFIIILSTCISCAQPTKQNYQGEWVGFLPDTTSFNFQVTIEKVTANRYHLSITNNHITIDKNLQSSSKDSIRLNIDNQLFFNLKHDADTKALTGFIKTGKFFYHVHFPEVGTNKFSGAWNAFMADNELQSNDIMLYVEHTDNGDIMAFPFFGDQRFRGMWPHNFKKQGDTVLFEDSMTGFNLRAKLLENTIELEILLTDVLIAKTSLTHTDDGWDYNQKPKEQEQNTNTPKDLNDGWNTSSITDYGIDKAGLERLIDSIQANTLVNTHSVLIAKDNKLVFESYFDGHNANIPHDLRSASKSISSAMIGIAIDDGVIKSVDEKLYDFIPANYQYTKDDKKSDITLKDLLTMSGGLDVNNLASEDYYQNPMRNKGKKWLQSVLEAPMVKTPGTYADYGSANPFLLGVYLNERLDMPMEQYMHQKLFEPLGITNYINQTDDSMVIPYFGGGMLLTSRDLLKFGQLFLNKGHWNGKQLISEKWIAESFQKHMRLQDVRDKNHYGYLWWHDTYVVNGKPIEAVEARGAGGQFIFILPELESVVVITSGNFRNRKGNQARDILRDYILPAMLH
ncbi:serine hydrolase [Spongiivirga sp. MCCC 1A20706]|uniref:serine hydrolase domain-containing protein n=1 Tax=Spongiivirga sp. MCCC 1A20706 TaxID=3160963 RepID=UPI003977A5F4